MLTPLTAALGIGAVRAQTAPEDAASAPPALQLQTAPTLQPQRGSSTRGLPIILLADAIRGRPDLETVAEGHAEFRQGGMLIRADRLSYDQPEDLARAVGNVRATRDGNVYTGSELSLHVEAFEGYFLEPTYFISQTGGGGTAERIDFIDDQRSRMTGATYSSCRPDGGGTPAWILSADHVKLDLEANEGVAEGAVLRFYDVPIFAIPKLSFPLTDARKSGWLPPTLNIDSKNGVNVEVPYYWNIAPQRDATITPIVISRRGVGVETEFRYLDPNYSGITDYRIIPDDRLAGRSRWALDLTHNGKAPNDVTYDARVLRVSDDNYWKDFTSFNFNLMPRLLPTDVKVNRNWTQTHGEWSTYARLEQWQVLQDIDPTAQIVAPYQRTPQLGARYGGHAMGGFETSLETEYNRFTLPDGNLDPTRPIGSRVHALGSISRPYITPGFSFVPRISFNAASYNLDQPLPNGRTSDSRVIPTLSIDAGWTFERDTAWFGKALRQTLEPRLYYVNTPYREQDTLPNFDSAVRDFNFDSIYTDNAFSGVDRVSDAHQLTAGVTSRVLDPVTGAEVLRLGAAQRYLFRDQKVTADDGPPLTKSFSDILLLASTTLVPKWTLDTSLQYSPDTNRTVRSIAGLRYSPGPFRTINAAYRFTRDSSEQFELGWQWPVYQRDVSRSKLAAGSSAACAGTLYAVGRLNYSMRDSRMTDSIVGFEYDAGCWIGRVVAERLSTGQTEATTRLLFQIEFVGLSRVGPNPLQVLKDNIPGYRLLRDERTTPAATAPSYE